MNTTPAIRQDSMALTLFIAASLHALFILGIGFDFVLKKQQEHRQKSLQVMVVRAQKPPEKEVEKPDFLAQTNQQGSGSNPKVERPSATMRPQQRHEAAGTARQSPAPARQKVQPQARLTTTGQGASASNEPKPIQQQRLTTAQLMASRNQEIARITASLERKSADYAKRKRRKPISANTREYKYAAYLDAWRRKVERIGNLNYPDEAARKKLHGNLLLSVSVLANGTIEQINILHSSGHKILDDAAIRIVRLAAPFSPFPQTIRQDVDVLDITRTWQFQGNNQLSWE
ncbi:MAG: energy transducer TonB [Candidatus Polarisedimenticolaceae bacterium]|nr:energy transducer TonB [Candidatus Polarisedimenticolaceae bacterium]